MSPDPLAGSVGNPQSLNRYAYVVNNPTNFRDPLGFKIIPDPGWFLGGGFGSKCTIDGLEAPCSMAVSLVNGGGAAICPNNNCTGLQLMGNTFYQWMLAPFSSVIGSLCQPDQPSQCTPEAATYNFKWGWVAVGTADSSGLSDLLGSFGYAADTKLLQAKVFLGALGRNFVDEFKNGGCVGQFFDEMLPTNLNDTPAFQDAAHDSASMLGASAAMSYAGAKALTYPLRSSMVRDLLSLGEDVNVGFAVLGVAQEGIAFYREMRSLSQSTCH